MARIRRGAPYAALLASVALFLAFAWLSRLAGPTGPPAGASGPWLLVPTPGGAFAFGPGRAALAVGACPPLCLQGGRPDWAYAPSGRRLAWFDRQGEGAELRVVDLAGSEPSWDVPLPRPAGAAAVEAGPPWLAWSPDGRFLFATRGGGTPAVADLARRSLAPLPGLSANLLRSLAWDPGGRRLAVLVDGEPRRPAAALLVLDASDGRTLAAALALEPAPGLGWLGGMAAFCADTRLVWQGGRPRGTEPRLWRLDPATGRLRAGPPLPEGAKPVLCAPSDRATYAFLRRTPSGPADLFRLDGTRWTRLTHFGPDTEVVAWAAGPEGALAWVLETGGRADRRTVWRVFPGGPPRRVGPPGGYGEPSWIAGRPHPLAAPEPAWRAASMGPWPRDGSARS